MLEATHKILVTDLAAQIDELSTRLIIDGTEAVYPSDFEQFCAAASQLGSTELETAAARIAILLSSEEAATIPDRTRIVSLGIEELRSHLEEHQDKPQASQSTEQAKIFQAHSNIEIQGEEPHSLATDENLICEFINESTEHLVTIETQLLLLEKGNSSAESLNAIFRGFHTIKGLAGFLDFADIQSLAHEVETLLDLARTGRITISPSVIDLLLESNDVVRHELNSISQSLIGTAATPTRVTTNLLNRIRSTASTFTEPTEAAYPTPQLQINDLGPYKLNMANAPQVQAHVEADMPQRSLETVPFRQEPRASGTTSVRIDTSKLDQLMDTVGEMVIAQTLIYHSPLIEASKDTALQRNLTQLARTTTELQRIATAMRMVPIGDQFKKTERMVRDLARRFGKQISFESSGEDAELDKSIAEQLSDPLLHMVRNSIDHGIESPEERIRLGKDPTARIRVAAFHQSGQIGISISDDGRGLDREKILAKAVQNGLIPHGTPTANDGDIYSLIFEPGFSTAEKVTDTSGRGVGMDVVRKQVQKLRGRIEIQSEPGIGTTFLIKLPLTLAIIDGLVVNVGDQRYVAPMFSIREIVNPTKSILSTIHGRSEMAQVRGASLPIVRLHRSFGIEPRARSLTDGILIVMESEGKAFCLFVDQLVGNQEVVIKSLGRRFKDISGIAGCTILGDGCVGLILDIDGIYRERS
jgi:two-component system chemotaxis sensor kinase CheA